MRSFELCRGSTAEGCSWCRRHGFHAVTQGVGVSPPWPDVSNLLCGAVSYLLLSVTQGVGVSPPSPLSPQEIFCCTFTSVGMSLHPPPYSRGIKVGVGKPEIPLVT